MPPWPPQAATATADLLAGNHGGVQALPSEVWIQGCSSDVNIPAVYPTRIGTCHINWTLLTDKDSRHRFSME